MTNPGDIDDSKQPDKVHWEKFEGKPSISEESTKIEEQEPEAKKEKSYLPLPLLIAALMIMTLLVLTFFPSPSSKDRNQKKPEFHNARKEQPAKSKTIEVANDPKGKCLSVLEQSINIEKRLPKHSEVSIPELLNSFSLEINSKVILYSGCKLGVEILPSPWRPSASLVIVKLRTGKVGPRSLSLHYDTINESVTVRRMLGYVTGNETSRVSIVANLESEKSYLFVLEVESRDVRLGKLLWSIDGKMAPEMELLVDAVAEPSNDGKLIALISAFGLWLRGENSAIIDDFLVLGLARELAAGTLPEEQYKLLSLIDSAVKLKE